MISDQNPIRRFLCFKQAREVSVLFIDVVQFKVRSRNRQATLLFVSVISNLIEDDPRNHTKEHEFSEISCYLVDRLAGASAMQHVVTKNMTLPS